jgi:hypothetical protein
LKKLLRMAILRSFNVVQLDAIHDHLNSSETTRIAWIVFTFGRLIVIAIVVELVSIGTHSKYGVHAHLFFPLPITGRDHRMPHRPCNNAKRSNVTGYLRSGCPTDAGVNDASIIANFIGILLCCLFVFFLDCCHHLLYHGCCCCQVGGRIILLCKS